VSASQSGSLASAEFVCNVCGEMNRRPPEGLGRERPGCSACGANVRLRGMLRALSQELFGLDLTLPEFPRVKSLRGLGLSDSENCAARLAQKFDYRNTYFHREPLLDITRVSEGESGQYDFVLASEVFEHVPPPAERAFENAFRLLREGGALVFTVPYSLDAATAEHFPELGEHGLARVGDGLVLVNRSRSGELQVLENLVFHVSFGGQALEMREFSECALQAMLRAAGFAEVRIYADPCPTYGIESGEAWSLPMAARKGRPGLSRSATRDVVEEWHGLKRKFDADMRRLGRSWWFRVGRKMGWV
jgi:SAM-dependent methyltransferase